MHTRIKRIYSLLEKKNLDALLLSSPANISYLTGFKSRDAYALISKKGNLYFTDSRYTEEVMPLLNGFSLKMINGFVFKIIAEACNSLGLKSIGFEERVMPVAEYDKIREFLKETKLIPTANIVEALRQIKDKEEIRKLKKSIEITIKAFRFIKKFIIPGKSELEIAAELERFIRYNGASASSFDIIVASGPNSSFPHHLTSRRRLKANEAVLIDMGVEIAGYKSDLTRVFFSGKIKPLEKKIYTIVKDAQLKALERAKPGIRIRELDSASRGYISLKGYGAFFSHNLGHGVGLEVHEAPHISSKNDFTLIPGMVATIEPAIYLPGKFGIRIEDMILITRKGVDLLSGSLNK